MQETSSQREQNKVLSGFSGVKSPFLGSYSHEISLYTYIYILLNICIIDKPFKFFEVDFP